VADIEDGAVDKEVIMADAGVIEVGVDEGVVGEEGGEGAHEIGEGWVIDTSGDLFGWLDWEVELARWQAARYPRCLVWRLCLGWTGRHIVRLPI
jgi:hypothetical protein